MRFHRWGYHDEAITRIETEVFISDQCELCFYRMLAREGLLRDFLPARRS
jgi:hypothetical protein